MIIKLLNLFLFRFLAVNPVYSVVVKVPCYVPYRMDIMLVFSGPS